ncbi:hypothetical protein TKK_0013308 [Trichogramma kaykai]
MSKRKTTRYVQNIEIEEFEDGNCDVFVIPQDDDPNDSESEDTDNSQNNMQVMSYSEVLNNYTENQSQLEPGYTYDWINGEKKYNFDLKNENFLPDETKKFIRDSSYVELFELFFPLS